MCIMMCIDGVLVYYHLIMTYLNAILYNQYNQCLTIYTIV